MKPSRRVRTAAATGAAVVAVVAAQMAWVSPANFQGHDEWLLIDIASRGALGVPYANRPLVALWHAVAQRAWPDDLRAYWLFAGLAFAATGLLTGAIAARCFPRAPHLAFFSGVLAAAWAPLDWLRLDTALVAGYAGFTASATAGLLLLVESWLRRSRAMLLGGGAVGLASTLGVEGVLPLLAAGPLLLFAAAATRGGVSARGGLARWVLAWTGFVLLGGLFVAAPAIAGVPTYQTGALRIDPAPLRVVARLGQLLGMQALPLVTSATSELVHPAVCLAVLGLVLGAVGAWRAAPRASRPRPGASARAVLLGLALACAGHAGLALTASVRDPARSQILSAPGFGLALAAAFAWAASWLGPRFGRGALLALAAWTVAVGTGRLAAMQAEWDAGRSAFPLQRRALADLVERAPALRPNTLLVLLDGERAAFPLGFTFRHAVSLLYSGQAVGLAPGAEPFLYPWYRLPEGIAVVPWPIIREPWGVAPSAHRWDEIVVARAGPGGAVELLAEWPAEALGPLPEDVAYDPRARVVPAVAAPPARRLLGPLR